MSIHQPGLSALRERVAPFLSNENAAMSRAMGSALLNAGIESEPEAHAAEAVLTFALQGIPAETITDNVANVHLLEVTSNIVARNWLSTAVESPEDNRVMASVIIDLFSEIPTNQIREASYNFTRLRQRYGAEHRDFDTTTRLMTLLSGIAPIDTTGPGRVESSLRAEQIGQIQTIRDRLPQPELAPPRAEFINGRLTYIRD